MKQDPLVAPWKNPNMRWVCEEHPTQDQEHRLFPWSWKRCGGAGMPDPKLFDHLGQPLTTKEEGNGGFPHPFGNPEGVYGSKEEGDYGQPDTKGNGDPIGTLKKLGEIMREEGNHKSS